jgi:hypothetical protein
LVIRPEKHGRITNPSYTKIPYLKPALQDAVHVQWLWGCRPGEVLGLTVPELDTSIWALLLFPMVGLSWICNKAPVLRDVIGIVFIPWAVIADTFVALMPSMGELENRASKLMLCGSWPFTWEFWQFLSHNLDLHDYHDPAATALNEVVERMSAQDPLMQRVLMRVATGQQRDAHEVATG